MPKRTIEGDVLQKKSADLIAAIERRSDLAVFGEEVSSARFVPDQTVRGIISTGGITKFEKVSKIMSAVKSYIINQAAQDKVTEKFDAFVLLLRDKLELDDVAKDLADALSSQMYPAATPTTAPHVVPPPQATPTRATDEAIIPSSSSQVAADPGSQMYPAATPTTVLHFPVDMVPPPQATPTQATDEAMIPASSSQVAADPEAEYMSPLIEGAASNSELRCRPKHVQCPPAASQMYQPHPAEDTTTAMPNYPSNMTPSLIASVPNLETATDGVFRPFGSQSNGRFIHTLLELERVHSQGITGEGIRLAIIERRYNSGHAAFSTSVQENVYDQTVNDQINHGTAVAGIAVGKKFDSQHSGYLYPGGVAPGTDWKVFDAYEGDAATLLTILEYIASGKDGKYKVITISSGGEEPDVETNKKIEGIIDKLHHEGTTIFASSGNDGDQNPVAYPASLNNVISVGSLTYGAKIAGHAKESNVDVYCYGEEIITPHGNWNELCVQSGSSMATPAVAGLACLAFQCAGSDYTMLHHIDKMKAMLNGAMRKGGEKYVLKPAEFLVKAFTDKSHFENLRL